MENKYITLIDKYLEGGLDSKETALFLNKLKEDESFKEDVLRFSEIQALLYQDATGHKMDDKIYQLIVKEEARPSLSDRVMVSVMQEKVGRKIWPLLSLLGIVLLAPLGFFIIKDSANTTEVLVKQKWQRVATNGSSYKTINLFEKKEKIKLYPGTQIEYIKNQVRLVQGRIIVHSIDQDHKTTYFTKNSTLQLIGTIFDYQSYKQNGILKERLVVKEGSVLWKSKENSDEELLKPLDVLSYSKNIGMRRKRLSKKEMEQIFKEKNSNEIYSLANSDIGISQFWSKFNNATFSKLNNELVLSSSKGGLSEVVSKDFFIGFKYRIGFANIKDVTEEFTLNFEILNNGFVYQSQILKIKPEKSKYRLKSYYQVEFGKSILRNDLLLKQGRMPIVLGSIGGDGIKEKYKNKIGAGNVQFRLLLKTKQENLKLTIKSFEVINIKK